MALGLAGCGTEQQDGGNGNNSGRSGGDSNSLHGVVVDGPVTRATVFFDVNNNLRKDSFEPSALTDNNGYFNADQSRNIYYCDNSPFASLPNYTFVNRPEFCLEINLALVASLTAETNLIVTGGYDLYTGEPFTGSMSMPLGQSAANAAFGGIAITPLSSLMSNVTNGDNAGNATGFLAFLASHGLDENTDLNVNYLDPADPEGDGQADNFEAVKHQFAITYLMHKMVVIMTHWAETHYPEIGTDDKLPNDISSLVYQQMHNFLADDQNAVNTAIDTIKADITKLYTDAAITAPATPASADIYELYGDWDSISSAITIAFGNSISNISLGNLGVNLTFANVKARVRGVEVVVAKILQGADNASIANAINALNNPAYLENLKGNLADGGNINFTQLVEYDGSDFATASALAKDTTGSSLQSELAGQSLTFTSNTATINSSAAIFFSGEKGDTKGNIHLCLKYSDDNNSKYHLEGDYISGTWETLPALNNTVMLDLNYLGRRSAVLKKIGENDDGSIDYRFEFADKITKFSSDQDLAATPAGTVIPNTHQTCQSYLSAMVSAD